MKNPVKWMLIVLIVLVLASIAINLFGNKKVNLVSGEVGFWGTEPKAGKLMPASTELVTDSEIVG